MRVCRWSCWRRRGRRACPPSSSGDDGSVTRLYEYGPEIGAADEQALMAAAAAHAAGGGVWALVCGAAPPGAAAGLYAGLVRTLREAGYRVMIDAAGEQLTGALTEHPDFVKVNLAEACGAVGEPQAHCLDERLASAADLAAEALQLSRLLVAGRGRRGRRNGRGRRGRGSHRRR